MSSPVMEYPPALHAREKSRRRSMPEPITCSGCNAVWTATGAAHCSAAASLTVPLASWDGDPGLLAKRYAHLYERPVDGGRIMAELLSDLGSTPASRVKVPRLHVPRLYDHGALVVGRPPRGSIDAPFVMEGGVFLGRQWAKILWAVIGSIKVSVVDVIFGRHESVDHPVFVGLKTLVWPDAPTESDVPMRSEVPLRLIRRDLLACTQVARRHAVTLGPTGGTVASLSSSGNELVADDARLRDEGGHKPILLHVDALCHRTFSTPRLFDSHRHARGDHGGCLNPATLTNARTGDRIMFLRDGMWRNPEMPPDQRERVAALAEQRKAARLDARG